MKIDPPLLPARLIKRYKRFLADVRLPDGSEITIHCPNTGSMRECMEVGSLCWYSTSGNPKRKYPNTWEIATTPAGDLAGINTGRANGLVVEAIANGLIEPLQGYGSLQTEVRYGEERSRIDIFLSGGKGDCYVEVKSVTLCERKSEGYFPDAVSARGAKHLRELMLMVERGFRAVLVFCVQHSAIESVAPAREIDPLYAATLLEAVDRGVEVLAYRAKIGVAEIVLEKEIPVRI